VRRALAVIAWVLLAVSLNDPFNLSPLLSNFWGVVPLISLLAFIRLYIFTLQTLAGGHLRKPLPLVPDERQHSVTARVHLISYRIFAVPLLGTFFIFLVDGPGQLFTYTLCLSFFLFFFLPTTVTAWLEPDPVDEDNGVAGRNRGLQHET
jgi:hypothetical protein